MRDTRFQALAKQLTSYSTELQAGQRVLLELTDIPEEMSIALIREVRHLGAIPFVNINQSRVTREMLMGATPEQYELIGQMRLEEIKKMDAFIEIRGGDNAFELSSVPAKPMSCIRLLNIESAKLAGAVFAGPLPVWLNKLQ